MTPRRVGLVEACDDRQLFGFPLWPKQRDLLSAIEEEAARLHVLALGRRGTKTTMKALTGLWCCLLRPELLEFLLPGERGYAVGVATNLRQARLLMGQALAIVERSPLLSAMVEESSADEIKFTNSTGFSAFPCTARGGRGWPIFCLLMDEAAHFVDTEGNSAAESIWQALSPATAQFGDAAKVVVGSTPWGAEGFFADLHGRAAAGEIPGARAHHFTSAEMNPTLSAEFLDAERIVLGEEAFSSEYLATFEGGGGSFLDPDQVRDAIAERGELRPEDATSWVAGLDPAFSSDPFGLCLVGQDRERGVLVVGMARRWLPVKRLRSFEERRAVEDELLAEVAEICRHYRAKVYTDQYAAPSVVARLKEAGLQVELVTMTASSKTAAFGELRARLAANELELYREPQLLAELRRLRARFSAGHAAVTNPRSGDSHGDVAQACALGVWAQRGWSKTARPASISVPHGEIANPHRLDGGLTQRDIELQVATGQPVTVRPPSYQRRGRP
jgi:hypothetical protein